MHFLWSSTAPSENTQTYTHQMYHTHTHVSHTHPIPHIFYRHTQPSHIHTPHIYHMCHIHTHILYMSCTETHHAIPRNISPDTKPAKRRELRQSVA